MADIVKLKKKAADFEAKKQMDKALEVFLQIVEAYEAGDHGNADISLYNRVGDLLQRAGRGAEAAEIWEKAINRYAEGGFYNPAIALCNKILRQMPGRVGIYYKLGKIHAQKGFKADARQNFLEYANRQQKSGNLDEAFRALKEFADLVPDQHDLRIMLADQLLKAGRRDEAVAQLQQGYSRATADGDAEASAGIVAKLKDIDPSIEPEATTTSSSTAGGDLVFLDIDDDAPLGSVGRDALIIEPTSLGDDLLPAPLGPLADLPLIDLERSAEVELPLLDEPAGLPLIDMGEPESAVTLPLLDVVLPSSAQGTLDDWRAQVEENPEDWVARHRLADALVNSGEFAEAMKEFETAMAGFEAVGNLEAASAVADDVIRIDAKSIPTHRKRVEFALRANDRLKLAEAYRDLADALLADGQRQKARTVYLRVLEITPADDRVQAAIDSIPLEEASQAPAPARRSTAAVPVKADEPVASTMGAAAGAVDGRISLGDWLREDLKPKSTRLVVEEKEPTGDQQADFADILREFRQGVSENLDDEDHEALYDLGLAFKEMGLVDDAIAAFQRALRGTKDRVRTFEALGACFLERQQLPVAATILQRALSEPRARDESLVGVLYLLGSIAEAQGQFAEAKKYYERVYAVDIQFRDIGARLNIVEQQLS